MLEKNGAKYYGASYSFIRFAGHRCIVVASSDLCLIHIGIDDFDHQQYGCTTHAATYLLHKLSEKFQILLPDYPNLVRLNPSIPWKTRGNGAVALRILLECSRIGEAVEFCAQVLLEYQSIIDGLAGSLPSQDAEPGLIIAVDPIPRVMARVYTMALTDVLLPSVVLEKLKRYENVYLLDAFKNRGVVGASAAVGWFLVEGDYTYELLTYRSKRLYGVKRCIERSSVENFDVISGSDAFNTVDRESGRILIESHGMDPVLYGVRGESPEVVKKALSIVRACEPITAWTIFRSNQATDAHAVCRSIDELRIYTSSKLHVVIASKPEVLPGGTVVVKAFDATGAIDLAFFKPSTLTEVALDLCVGDEAVVQGHVKPWGRRMVFHVEKIQLVAVKSRYICRAPRCPVCRRRTEKIGWGKGYRCSKCDVVIMNPELECVCIPRSVQQRLYAPPSRAQKHLIKPVSRYGREKSSKPTNVLLKLLDVSQIIEPLWFL